MATAKLVNYTVCVHFLLVLTISSHDVIAQAVNQTMDEEENCGSEWYSDFRSEVVSALIGSFVTTILGILNRFKFGIAAYCFKKPEDFLLYKKEDGLEIRVPKAGVLVGTTVIEYTKLDDSLVCDSSGQYALDKVLNTADWCSVKKVSRSDDKLKADIFHIREIDQSKKYAVRTVCESKLQRLCCWVKSCDRCCEIIGKHTIYDPEKAVNVPEIIQNSTTTNFLGGNNYNNQKIVKNEITQNYFTTNNHLPLTPSKNHDVGKSGDVYHTSEDDTLTNIQNAVKGTDDIQNPNVGTVNTNIGSIASSQDNISQSVDSSKNANSAMKPSDTTKNVINQTRVYYIPISPRQKGEDSMKDGDVVFAEYARCEQLDGSLNTPKAQDQYSVVDEMNSSATLASQAEENDQKPLGCFGRRNKIKDSSKEPKEVDENTLEWLKTPSVLLNKGDNSTKIYFPDVKFDKGDECYRVRFIARSNSIGSMSKSNDCFKKDFFTDDNNDQQAKPGNAEVSLDSGRSENSYDGGDDEQTEVPSVNILPVEVLPLHSANNSRDTIQVILTFGDKHQIIHGNWINQNDGDMPTPCAAVESKGSVAISDNVMYKCQAAYGQVEYHISIQSAESGIGKCLNINVQGEYIKVPEQKGDPNGIRNKGADATKKGKKIRRKSEMTDKL